MCGIFGFAGFDDPGVLERMGERIRHRGPDDHGFFEHGEVHLGARRLSIIDVAGGHQPMAGEDGAIVVVHNGEIYNYRDLIPRLEALGHRFRTHCDTEVIVHAYEAWGRDCLAELHGMFAFALYDRRRDALFIARDRTGMKPLYYFHQDGRLVFASEIKAILECGRVPRRCNLAAIDSYLALRYVPQPETLFTGIHVLPAAHSLTWESGRLAIQRYWDLPQFGGPYESDDAYLEAFDATFTRAIERHMQSEVPVGAYLSGGVDSSAIVATMCRLTSGVKTFSLGFNAPGDETAEARTLADRLGCDHHEIICRPEHFSLLPETIYHLERPIGDALILAYYLLAEETRRHVKVVLSGEGADELFAGYSFHKVMEWTRRYTRWMPGAVDRHVVVPALRHAPVNLLDRFFVFPAQLGRQGRDKVADFLAAYREQSLYANYISLRTLFNPTERRALYSPAFAQVAQLDVMARHPEGAVGAAIGLVAHTADLLGPATPPPLDRLLGLQFEDWLQDFALLRQDKSSMAHSLELRLPFLDDELIDLAFRMPPRLKLHDLTDKVVERRWAQRLLPAENTRRSKNPFYLPVDYFYGQGAVAELIERTLAPDAVRRRGYFDPAAVQALVDRMPGGEFLVHKQVMALVILELWHQVFIDGDLPPLG
jgi:asparagine synthase (glutamine-hydrolysing)